MMKRGMVAFALSLFIPLYITAEVIAITVEHAATSKERAKGLMGRTTLPLNHGMAFTYDTPHRISIWMYQTLIDLSVAFLDQDKVIREIHELRAYPQIRDKKFFHQKSVTSSFDANYVLEMNKGWFEVNNVKEGDLVVWELSSPHGFIIKKPVER